MVEPFALPVHVDAVEHDLARSEALRGAGDGDRAYVAGLPAALDGALVPAELLAVRSLLGLVELDDLVEFVIYVVWRVDVDTLGIDRYHHGLDAVYL